MAVVNQPAGWLVAITAVDGREHLVPDHALGEQATDGWYRARCGMRVAAAAMAQPPGPPCASCRSRLPAPAQRDTARLERLVGSLLLRRRAAR
jgi:hypothetical protein